VLEGGSPPTLLQLLEYQVVVHVLLGIKQNYNYNLKVVKFLRERKIAYKKTLSGRREEEGNEFSTASN